MSLDEKDGRTSHLALNQSPPDGYIGRNKLSYCLTGFFLQALAVA